MVAKINSNHKILDRHFPKVNKLIADFIDALVSLRVDPKAEFTKEINNVVQKITPEDWVESDWGNELYKIFFNKDLVKWLNPKSLFHLLGILVADHLNKKIRFITKEDIQILFGRLDFSHYETAFRNILEVLRDFYGINDPSTLLYNYSKDNKSVQFNALPVDHFQHEEIKFPSDVEINSIRKKADLCEKHLYTIIEDLPDYYSEDRVTPLSTALRYFQKNKNIIPLFKILNLRPLVGDLNGFMNLSEDKVIKQVARALNEQLTAKAPRDQLDYYKKLALAVFPKEIAGRLRAAGFDLLESRTGFQTASQFLSFLKRGKNIFY